jgi:hypothetical protein
LLTAKSMFRQGETLPAGVRGILQSRTAQKLLWMAHRPFVTLSANKEAAHKRQREIISLRRTKGERVHL